jgi:type VI secretion system secreted protein Hcp
MIITFSNGLVSSFKTVGNMRLDSGTGSADVDNVLPIDEIKVNFARIELEYREQRNDGTMGAVIKAGYDLKLNAPV